MSRSDVKLVRVFTREIGAVIADMAFPSNSAFEAVIECKAGTAIHDMGARYEIKIDVIDFSAMVTIVSSAVVAAGLMGDEGWPTLAQQFVFPISEPGAAYEGHIWKVFASLKVGVVNPYASLAESDLFLINSPYNPHQHLGNVCMQCSLQKNEQSDMGNEASHSDTSSHEC